MTTPWWWWWSKPVVDNPVEGEEEAVKKTYPPYPTIEQIEEDPDGVRLTTAPYDPRHPNTNQTRHCFQNYVDYHRCLRKLAKEGVEEEGERGTCFVFRRLYHILCPSVWTEQWDEWVREGRAPFYLDPPAAWNLAERLEHLEMNEERARQAVSSGHQVRLFDAQTGASVDSVYEHSIPSDLKPVQPS
jgi:cytochrome c oxidase subunit 6b